MKKIFLCLILVSAMMCSLEGNVLAQAVMSPVEGWEDSYWNNPGDFDAGTAGVDVTSEPEWVKNGKGALHIWVGKNSANLNAQAVQAVSGLTAGKQYRLSGSIYITSKVAANEICIGDTEVQFRNMSGLNANGWYDMDYTFEFSGSNKTLMIILGWKSDLYADDLSLKEIVSTDIDGENIYGEELLENGDFEADFIPPSNISDLRANAYTNTAELFWSNPDDTRITAIEIFNGEDLVAAYPASQKTAVIDGLINGVEYTFTVKTKNKKNVYSAGVSVKVTPVKKLARPNVMKDDESNKVIGLTTDTEYSSDNGITWTKFDGENYPVFEGDITVFVRTYTEEVGAVAEMQTLYFTKNAENSSDILIKKSEIVGNEYFIEGELKDKTAAQVTLLLVKKDADRRETDKILAIGQTTSATDGKFTITVNLADERNGVVNDGTYTVYVDSTVTDEVIAGDAVFVNSIRRNAAFEDIWTTENLSGLFEENSANYDSYIALGLPVEDYNGRSDAVKAGTILDFEKLLEGTDSSIGSEETTKLFIKALVMNVLENGNTEEAYEVIKKYNDTLDLKYNTVSWSGLLADNSPAIAVICEYMAGNKYNSADDINKYFAVGYGLYEINNATYGNISSIIEKHSEVMELSGTYYSQYMALTEGSTRKTNINKSIVLAKTKAEFKSPDDVLDAIKNAVISNPAATVNNGTSYGGGSSGGNSGGNSLAAAVRESLSKPSVSVNNNENPTDSSTALFNDLATTHWAAASIKYLNEKGIINGYEDGSFAPSKPVTRAEAAAIIVRAFDVTADNYSVSFDDVTEGSWYYDLILTAADAKIVFGKGNGLFGVDESITRQDLAVMLYRQIESSLSVEADNNCFTDFEEVSDYAKTAVSMMKSKGHISGYEDGSFRPYQTATRAEVAQILYSVLTNK